MRELDYLRTICSKYGTRYIYKYFGFKLKDLADLMGVKEHYFSAIIHGRIKKLGKHETAFLKAFKELKIEEKTKNFKESKDQLWMKEYWLKQKNT